MRLLYSAGLCVLALSLTACSQGGSAPAETMLSMPPSPAPEPGTPTAPSVDAVPTRPAGDPMDGRETGTVVTSDPSDHCVIVAGGVTTAMLAPMGLRSSADPDELVALEQQILELRDKVPADLHDDFTTLAHSVEAPPEGSGTFDEKAFRRAMVPVQDWLSRHCAGS